MRKGLILILMVLLAAGICHADTAKESKKKQSEMTAAELAAGITRTLKNFKEIMNFIPGLTRETEEASAEFYAYDGMRLDRMPKSDLSKLYRRVHSHAVTIRTERINRQLDSIRRSQNLMRPPSQVPTVAAPPPPPVQNPPRIPKLPPRETRR